MTYDNFQKDLEYSKTVNINNVYRQIIEQEFPNSHLDLCVTLEDERNGIDGYIRLKNRKASVQFKVLYGEKSWFTALFLPFEVATSFDNWQTIKKGWLYHTNATYFIYIRALQDQSDYAYYAFNTKPLLNKVKELLTHCNQDVEIKTNKENTAKLFKVYLSDIRETTRVVTLKETIRNNIRKTIRERIK